MFYSKLLKIRGGGGAPPTHGKDMPNASAGGVGQPLNLPIQILAPCHIAKPDNGSPVMPGHAHNNEKVSTSARTPEFVGRTPP